MSVATGLIAKLLLAISVIPAAGYGGYCAYDHYNPTFHNFMEREGFMWFPIDGDMKIGESSDKTNKHKNLISKNQIKRQVTLPPDSLLSAIDMTTAQRQERATTTT